MIRIGVSHLVTSCDSCQRHRRLQNQPATLMKGIMAACPFDQWGMDIVGPFPPAPAQKKFLLVAIDYFSKWVEAKVLARITEGDVLKFLWKNILCRFGVLGSSFLIIRDDFKELGYTPFSLVYGNEAVLPAKIGEESARIIFYDEKNGEKRMEDLDFLDEKREVVAIRMEA
ncbi:uncharacterized protein [Henckelia pumila]|uniref:uncharacterized protein n=1 Tax=Henckelia pumila TaxID=405737 RepID=UPI003C6DE346